VLADCDIVEELNGLSHNNLPTSMQIRLKRHFIRVEVITSLHPCRGNRERQRPAPAVSHVQATQHGWREP
jgi:hypothetical protein